MRLACAQSAYAQESINPGPLKKGCARTVLNAGRVVRPRNLAGVAIVLIDADL